MDETRTELPILRPHAAEFLANERTFLAWIRTSIAVMSLGFAVTRFDAWMRTLADGMPTAGVPDWSPSIGAAMIVLGGLLPAFAAWRYRTVNGQIATGQVRPDHALIAFVTVLVVALAAFFVLSFLKTGGNA